MDEILDLRVKNRTTLLEISNLSVEYESNQRKVLSNIEFKIEKSEIILITGPTGCGKSTLINSINGIIPNVIEAKVEGDILFKSNKINYWDIKKRSINGIGTVFQNPESQLFALTVEEDVAFGPENFGLKRSLIQKRVDKSLNITNLENLRSRFTFNLSGGEKQKLAISGILALKPDLILFDEPTSDLDFKGSKAIIKSIYRLAKEGNKGIILIEHKLNDIIDIIDKVYIVENGEIIIKGYPEDVFSKNRSIITNLGIKIPYKFDLKCEANSDNNLNQLNNQNQEDKKLLSVSGLTFAYNETKLFNNLDLEIIQGEFIALLGKNGSGKTTLAKLLIGLLKPNSGNIFFKGKKLNNKKVQQIASWIGYLFQNPTHQIFKNKVYQELAFGLKNLKYKNEEISKKIEEITQILKLDDLLERDTYTLSRGQAQRVALASVLIIKPELIILDEPTTGQDYRNRKKILDLSSRLNKDGISIILITHDIDLAYEYAQRIIILDAGTIILDGPPREVFKNKKLVQSAGLRIPKVMEEK
ncbi:MAG: ATP-binding cassette domain-containing protein [Candidatus Lokiarchaeota archaeon]|nr:ATP-binding cassette domain-containing protein [Candidatus Lokiarchaeota archaeon]